MAKTSVAYVCQHCGWKSLKWVGRCGGCGEWDSTVLLQVCQYISQKGYTTLYVTGEESVVQTKLRAERLSILSDRLLVVAETNLDFILENIHNTHPTLVVIDSIQMIYKPQLESSPGTVAQVRQCAYELIFNAKSTGSAIFLVGHVTKEGIIAGPKVLEHMADTVLYFEGEKFQCYRILRVV